MKRTRSLFILTFLALAIIVGAIALNTTSTFNYGNTSNSSKSNYILSYEVYSYGRIGDHIKSYIFTNTVNKIMEKYRDILAGNALKPKYYVVVYKNYSLYIKTWKKLSHSRNVVNDIELLQKYSCRIIASKIQILLTPLTITKNNILRVNITLIFNNGLAICGEKYTPLPHSNRKWIKKDENYITLFDTLNITRTAYVNRLNGAVTNSNGEFVGEWVFQLSINDLNKNSTLILYNIDTNTQTSIDNKTYPFANLIYLYKCKDLYISNPIVISLNNEIKKVEGINLIETIISPTPENYTNILGKIKVYNMPPFIQYYNYFKNNNTLIKPYIEITKIPVQKQKPWTNIFRIEKVMLRRELGNKNVSIEKIIYGIKINDEYYIASINFGIVNMTYNYQGRLIDTKINVYGGNLYSVFPSIINDLFGIGYESMTNSSIIEISLINEK